MKTRIEMWRTRGKKFIITTDASEYNQIHKDLCNYDTQYYVRKIDYDTYISLIRKRLTTEGVEYIELEEV